MDWKLEMTVELVQKYTITQEQVRQPLEDSRDPETGRVRKLRAIRYLIDEVRVVTGLRLSLKDAKDAVELVMRLEDWR